MKIFEKGQRFVATHPGWHSMGQQPQDCYVVYCDEEFAYINMSKLFRWRRLRSAHKKCRFRLVDGTYFPKKGQIKSFFLFESMDDFEEHEALRKELLQLFENPRTFLGIEQQKMKDVLDALKGKTDVV